MPERPQSRVEDRDGNVPCLVRAVDAIGEEHTALPHGQGRVRPEASNRLLWEQELAEDEAGGGAVPGQWDRRTVHGEAAARVGRTPDPEAVRIDAGDIEGVTRTRRQRDELRLDELAVHHLRR